MKEFNLLCPCCGQAITIIISDSGKAYCRFFDNSDTDICVEQLEELGIYTGDSSGKEEKD